MRNAKGKTMPTITKLADHAALGDGFDDCCPVHGGKIKKTYTFGSTMSAETDVHVFCGCGCAVAERHDPIGILQSAVSYHTSYSNASGVGKLHAMLAAAKYR